jgi:hypothetical protein
VNHGFDPAEMQACLSRAWSAATSGRWFAANPARGQCSVTALAVQRLAGGEILRTDTPAGPHFYNRIEGIRHDFTASQFERPPAYDDLLSSATEAMADTSPGQLAVLMRALERPA